MNELCIASIEEQLVEELPELAPAAAHYWKQEGGPGSDCGPYVFFEDVFACYVQILLALPATRGRDELLRRAFGFVERMVSSSDASVRDLAFIGLFEGREDWLFARSAPFVGLATTEVLDTRWPAWRSLKDERVPETVRSIVDVYHVRHVVADALREDGITLDDVPGRTVDDDGLS